MKVQDLVGDKIWVKPAHSPERVGHILSITNSSETQNIDEAILASFFKIELLSGDVMELSGMWIVGIDDRRLNPRWLAKCGS